jgi:hypothetical protein
MNDNGLEKGDKIDVHEQLAAEVYGIGEVDKFSTWGLRLRAWVRKLGAEENGIERIPPEARIDQNSRGTRPIQTFLQMRSILFLHKWQLLRDGICAGCFGTKYICAWMVFP